MPIQRLVGRAHSLRVLRAALAQASEGNGGLVLIAGEAGIGKTHLVSHFAAEAGAAGVLVRRAACWSGGSPPYWPWVQVLREHARDRDRAALCGEILGLAGTIGCLVPELESACPGRGGAVRRPAGRFELFDAVAELLWRATAAGPMLVVLEDLHLSDADSIHLLHFVARDRRTSRLLLVGTCRREEVGAEHPLRSALSDLAGRATRLRLDGLTCAEVGQLVRLAGGAEPSPEAVRALHARTGGNPFFVRELTGAAAPRLPDGIRDVILRRLARLSPACRELLVAAALAGTTFALDGVRQALGVSTARLHELICEASTHGLIVAVGDREASARFTHALIAEVLSDGTEAGGERRRCEALLASGRAAMAAGQTAAARAAFASAARAAKDGGWPELLARAAVGLRTDRTVGIVDELETRLLADALHAMGTADSRERAILLTNYARVLDPSGAAGERLALSDEALAIARRLGDAEVLATVLDDRHAMLEVAAAPEELLAICTEGAYVAEQAGDHHRAMESRAGRMGALLELGRMAELRADVIASDDLIRERGLVRFAWRAPMLRASDAILAGRLQDAERMAAEGLRLGRRVEHSGIHVYFGSLLCLVRFLQGRMAELEQTLRGFVAGQPAVVVWRCALGIALVEAGRAGDARHELDVLALDDFSALSLRTPTLDSLALLAVLCDLLDDGRRSRAVYRLLEPRADRIVGLGGSAIGCLGSAAHFLGLLAGRLGDHTTAIRHLDAAIEVNTRIGAIVWLAHARAHRARAILDAGGDAGEARMELDRANRAKATLGIADWPAGVRPAGVAPLTSREWEVAALIAEGLSDAQIARRLGIRSRTAEKHAENIRTKLAVDARTKIARWVLTNRST